MHDPKTLLFPPGFFRVFPDTGGTGIPFFFKVFVFLFWFQPIFLCLSLADSLFRTPLSTFTSICQSYTPYPDWIDDVYDQSGLCSLSSGFDSFPTSRLFFFVLFLQLHCMWRVTGSPSLPASDCLIRCSPCSDSSFSASTMAVRLRGQCPCCESARERSITFR